MPNHKQLSNLQMINLNFGYTGIQFAWALQFASISGVFKFLGASDDQIPLLWLAGPITGLIIPPIIGYISDFTWAGYLGKRRIYILFGSTLSMFALFAIPNTRNLYHAVILVWILDTGLNIAWPPYRALIADKTPIHQQTKCFSFLTIAACVGSALAFVMPWFLDVILSNNQQVNGRSLPINIEYAFIVGAVVLIATNFHTVISTKEQLSCQSHTNLNQPDTVDLRAKLKELLHLPPVMRDLIKVEFLFWIGMFSFIIYYALGIAQNIYHLPAGVNITGNQEYSKLLQKGIELCGLLSFVYTIISTLFATALTSLVTRWSRNKIYSIALMLGAMGILITSMSHTVLSLSFGVIFIGIAWGAALTLPFAILSSGVPKSKIGWYMGYYNLFIVLPQMIVSCSFGYIIRVFFNDHAMSVIMLGGCSMLLASIFALRIKDPYNLQHLNQTKQLDIATA